MEVKWGAQTDKQTKRKTHKQKHTDTDRATHNKDTKQTLLPAAEEGRSNWRLNGQRCTQAHKGKTHRQIHTDVNRYRYSRK